MAQGHDCSHRQVLRNLRRNGPYLAKQRGLKHPVLIILWPPDSDFEGGLCKLNCHMFSCQLLHIQVPLNRVRKLEPLESELWGLRNQTKQQSVAHTSKNQAPCEVLQKHSLQLLNEKSPPTYWNKQEADALGPTFSGGAWDSGSGWWEDAAGALRTLSAVDPAGALGAVSTAGAAGAGFSSTEA
jgi:hypothetical protein